MAVGGIQATMTNAAAMAATVLIGTGCPFISISLCCVFLVTAFIGLHNGPVTLREIREVVPLQEVSRVPLDRRHRTDYPSRYSTVGTTLMQSWKMPSKSTGCHSN